MIFDRKIIYVIFLLSVFNFINAQGFSHENFPSKEDVFSKIKGLDKKETLLKQYQAFRFLRNEMTNIPEDKKSMKEKLLQNDYEQSLHDIRRKYNQEVGSFDRENAMFYDNKLEDFIINNLFDNQTRRSWSEREQRIATRDAKRNSDANAFDIQTETLKERKAQESEEKMFYILAFIVGIILSLNMLILDYLYGKRNQNRKIQNPDSYNISFMKAYGRGFLGCLSIIFMLLGFVIVAGTFHKVFG